MADVLRVAPQRRPCAIVVAGAPSTHAHTAFGSPMESRASAARPLPAGELPRAAGRLLVVAATTHHAAMAAAICALAGSMLYARRTELMCYSALADRVGSTVVLSADIGDQEGVSATTGFVRLLAELRRSPQAYLQRALRVAHADVLLQSQYMEVVAERELALLLDEPGVVSFEAEAEALAQISTRELTLTLDDLDWKACDGDE